ncbi:MAG: site-2 protease family protein [Candidatus Omnitrophica bacterium]|nr:site-2 protease family protein [Candidatus Omnitrophota bacterium]
MNTHIITVILYFVILLFSVIIHEVSHGLAALRNGDDTAYLMGRLTLNPLPHIDPFGSILLPFLLYIIHAPFLFGYAKPVPINPLRFKNYDRGMIEVGLSGCLANFIFGSICAFLSRFVSGSVAHYLLFAGFLNFLLGFFNLIPIPPLDGSRVLGVLLPPRWTFFYDRMERYGMFIVYFLVFFVGIGFLSILSNFFVSLIAGVPYT